jgi:hypothetical protein
MKAGSRVNVSHIGSVLFAVIISFFPKCPFCWAAYMSIFSSLGLVSIPYTPWLQPVMMGFFLVNIFALFTIAKKRKNYASFGLNATGVLLLIASKFLVESLALMYAGLLMIITASLWNLFTRKLACDSKTLRMTVNPSSGNQPYL